jgi:hypothetical protein
MTLALVGGFTAAARSSCVIFRYSRHSRRKCPGGQLFFCLFAIATLLPGAPAASFT